MDERRRQERLDIRWEMDLIRAMFRMPLESPERELDEAPKPLYCDVCDCDSNYCDDKTHPRSPYAPRS